MDTLTSTNAATVGAVYAAFGRGDIPAILDALAEDVVWEDWAAHTTQAAGVPWLARRRGPAEVAEFFALIAGWTVDEFTVLDVVGTGRQVAVEVRAAFTLPGGARYADEELHLWTFDDTGRVVRFRHYVDSAKHIAAARGEDTLSAGCRPGGS